MEPTVITAPESLVGEGLLEGMPAYEFRDVEEEAEVALIDEDDAEGMIMEGGEEEFEEDYEGPAAAAAVEAVAELSYLGLSGQEEEVEEEVGAYSDRPISLASEVEEEGVIEEGEEAVGRVEFEKDLPPVVGDEEVLEKIIGEQESKVSVLKPEKSSVLASKKLLEDVFENLFDRYEHEFQEEPIQKETDWGAIPVPEAPDRPVLKPEKIKKESVYADHMPSLIDLFPRGAVFQKPVDYQYFSCSMHDVAYQHGVTMTMVDSNLMALKKERIILRKDHSTALKNKVKILSGGIAGMEPLFSGFVGQGMLTGAAIGNFHHPPRPSTVYKAIKELTLDHKAGVILIVENCLETRLIFGQAMEKARRDGDLIDMITICDNARDSVRNDEVGRGSLTGLLVAFKIAGAMSDAGKPLAEIFFTVYGMNMSSISATIDQLSVTVGNDFHGDSGSVSSCAKLRTLVETMLDYLISPSRYFSLKVRPLSKVHLLVNNFTRDDVFLNTALGEILRQLFILDVDVNRIYAGTFVTGQPGLCITLIKDKNLELCRWLDEATVVPSWPRSPLSEIIPKVYLPRYVFEIPGLSSFGPLFTADMIRMIPLVIGSFCNEMGESEGALNYLDPLKKFGSSLLRCVKVIADHNLKGLIDLRTPFNTLKYIAHIIDKSGMGFTVALISILLKAIANDFLKYSRMEDLDHNMWGNALNQGVIAVKTYGGIKRNESSMLDVVGEVGQILAELDGAKTETDIMEEMMHAANDGIAKKKPKGRHLTGNKDPASVAAVMLFKCIAETKKQLVGSEKRRD